jgi:hypothetical protein
MDPAFRPTAVFGGCLLLAAAVGVFLLFLYADDSREFTPGALVVTEVFCLGGAGLIFWSISRFDNHAVAVDASGIRSLAPQRLHVHVAWESITDVRMRLFLQRLELFTRTAPPLRLEYQLEDFDLLLATLVREAPQLGTARSLPASFGRRPAVEVSEQEVRIRKLLGRRIRMPAIDGVLIHLLDLGKQQFDPRVQVSLHSQEVVTLPTSGSEIFDLYRTLQRIIADTTTP